MAGTTKRAAPPMKLQTKPLSWFRANPENYREHPDGQLTHIEHSLKEFGQFKNVVALPDGTILAGHGVVAAAAKAGVEKLAVQIVDLDEAQARKLMIADNELYRQAEDDDRLLTDLLKEISQTETGLEGTGFDEQMLANLVFVTRPQSEIEDFDAAAEWAGMPEYDEIDSPFVKPIVLVVKFRGIDDREEFIQKLGLKLSGKTIAGKQAAWWPPKVAEHAHDFRFEESE